MALATSSLLCDELCIITKVHPDHFIADEFIPSVEQSLKDLQVEQADIAPYRRLTGVGAEVERRDVGTRGTCCPFHRALLFN